MEKQILLLNLTGWTVAKNGNSYTCTIPSSAPQYKTLIKAIGQGIINGSHIRFIQVCTSGVPFTCVYSDVGIINLKVDLPNWNMINPSGDIGLVFENPVSGRLTDTQFKDQNLNKIYLEWGG